MAMLQSLKIIKLIYYPGNSLLRGNKNKVRQNICYHFFQSSVSSNSSFQIDEERTEKRKKTIRIPSITLIHPNQSETVTSLEDAERLAKRRNLQLVKLFTRTSERDTYKLYSPDQLIEDKTAKCNEDTEKFGMFKSEKVWIIKNKITDWDLNIKLKHINKLLKKSFRIKLCICLSDNTNEKLLENIKKNVEGTLVEEKKKHNNLFLKYHPLLDNKE